MRRSVWITLAVMIIAVASLLWWQQRDDVLPELVTHDRVKSEPKASANKLANVALYRENEENTMEDAFNPYESEVFKAQIQQIADLYEDSSKYPVNSRPIINPESVREPAPFEFNEVDLPFSTKGDDDNPIRLIAATNTHQFYQGDVIQIRVQISGAPSDTYIHVMGNLSSSKGDLPVVLDFQPTDGSLTQFMAHVDTHLLPTALTSPEMTVIVKVKVGTEDLLTSVPFRYDLPSAQIVGTLPARVDGPDLVIPVQVEVGQTGYYFLRAVLEDASTNQPLIELQNEGPLVMGNGLLNLNAHISALRYHESEGPYLLRSVKLHRGAEQGESFDVPASSLQQKYQVQGFPFSAYEDEEYTDELAQERLSFLRQIGSVDEEQVREQLSATADEQPETE